MIVVGVYSLGGISVPLLDAANLHGAAAFLSDVYSHTCHQIPERTFSVANTPFAFCARCTGYFGAMFSAAALVLLWRSPRMPLFALLASQIPMLVDVIFDLSARAASPNLWRSLFGALSGAALALWIYPRFLRALDEQLAESPPKP